MKALTLLKNIKKNKVLENARFIFRCDGHPLDYMFIEYHDNELWCELFGQKEKMSLTTKEIMSVEFEIIEEENKPIEEIKMCCSGIMGFDGVENICSVLKDKLNELIKEINKIKKENRE